MLLLGPLPLLLLPLLVDVEIPAYENVWLASINGHSMELLLLLLLLLLMLSSANRGASFKPSLEITLLALPELLASTKLRSERFLGSSKTAIRSTCALADEKVGVESATVDTFHAKEIAGVAIVPTFPDEFKGRGAIISRKSVNCHPALASQEFTCTTFEVIV